MAYINIGRGSLKHTYATNKKFPQYKGHFTFDLGVDEDGEPKLFKIPLAAWRRTSKYDDSMYFSLVSSMSEARIEEENPSQIPEEIMAILNREG